VEAVKKSIKEKITAENVIIAVIFIIASVALLWKCRYGYMDGDEGFYPTIADRFLQGDRLIYDEWHGTELSAVVIMPFLKLYYLINGSADGVYLFIRYAYTVVKIVISIFIYIRLKKYSKIGTFVSVIVFLFYSRACTSVLSYNSISFGGAVVAFLLLLNEKDTVKTRIYWVLAGVALSISVFGIPHNVVIYFAYVAAVIILSFIYKNADKNGKQVNKTIRLCYSYKALGFVTIGVGICVVIFFAYFFTQITLSQLLESLTYILREDPEHSARSLQTLTVGCILLILSTTTKTVCIIIAAILVVYLFDKKKNQRLEKYVCAAGVASIILILMYTFRFTYQLNVGRVQPILYVTNVLGILLYILVKDEKMKELFAAVVAPGFFVMYGEFLASNNGFYGMATASCVSAVGSVLIIMIVIERYLTDKTRGLWGRTAGITLACALSICVTFIAFCKLMFVTTGNEMVMTLDVKIESGVAKGLIVKQEQYDNYMAMYEDTEIIRSMPEETKVIYKADPMLWMAGNQRCASYSTYRGVTKVYAETLQKYYTVHPDKVADVIYVYGKDGSDEEELVNKLVAMYGYSVNSVNTGWILSK
jgi:hypothetical protein